MEVFDTDEIGKEEIVVDGKDSKQAEKGADEGWKDEKPNNCWTGSAAGFQDSESIFISKICPDMVSKELLRHSCSMINI